MEEEYSEEQIEQIVLIQRAARSFLKKKAFQTKIGEIGKVDTENIGEEIIDEKAINNEVISFQNQLIYSYLDPECN